MARAIDEEESNQLNYLYSRIKHEDLEDQDDPLAAYDDLLSWILAHHSDHTNSGLLELLEECLRKFHDDPRYTGAEYRYVRLWILYANHVERPTVVYEYMMSCGIGKLYASFFQQYLEALEREGRFSEADTIIALGIRTQAKPTKRLLEFQAEYRVRRKAGQPPTKLSCNFKEELLSAQSKTIRRNPLRNITRASDTGKVPNAPEDPIKPSSSARRPNPYAHLNVPPVPGKRPEKLRFDLTLLLEADGTEYCFEEVRARHLGLLGKKWSAPPPPNAAVAAAEKITSDHRNGDGNERSVKVNFNDQGTRSSKTTRRQSVTVTINTKQALEDVFEMYNSPDEGQLSDKLPEVKPITATPHDNRTPAAAGQRFVYRDENMGTATKQKVFQPLSEQKSENITPAFPRFQPILSRTPASNAFTPNLPRPALAPKDVITPVPAFKVVRPPLQPAFSATAVSELKPLTEESEEQENEDVFCNNDVTADDFTEEFTNPPRPPPPPRSFVPFTDNPFIKPLGNSDGQRSNSTQEVKKLQIYRDENHVGLTKSSASNGSAGPSKVPPFQPFFPINRRVDTEPKNNVEHDAPQHAEDRRVAMSSRFGHFEVMTPITERTAELSASLRAQDTPSDKSSTSVQNKVFDASDAQSAAEKLAAELQEEEQGEQDSQEQEEEEEEEDNKFINGTAPERHEASTRRDDFMDDSANMRDATQVLVLKSGFQPPNPCCPADEDIVSQLLTVLPPDPIHRDLRQVKADRLKHLKQFADKRNSGSGIARQSSDSSDQLTLELDGDRFEVSRKLGEGGFGAVFMAKWITTPEVEDEEDEEGGTNPMVAIKAVQPADVWETYVLQRILSAVSPNLRRSIICPYSLYGFEDESYLVLELCKQGTLLEIVNRASKIGLSQPGGGMEELLVMFFTVELMRIVEGLHSVGFIHGDLKIDNCLIRLEDLPEDITWTSEYDPIGENGWSYKGLKLIDFGRTIDTRLYPEGQMFVARWKTDQRDCLEMQEGRPWSYQADYAGLASIIYCMLFGKYIETVTYTSPSNVVKLKPSQPMKRYWQSDLWNCAFDILLNSGLVRDDHSLPIIDDLAQLRRKMENWITANSNKAGKNLKGMLKRIERESL